MRSVNTGDAKRLTNTLPNWGRSAALTMTSIRPASPSRPAAGQHPAARGQPACLGQQPACPPRETCQPCSATASGGSSIAPSAIPVSNQSRRHELVMISADIEDLGSEQHIRPEPRSCPSRLRLQGTASPARLARHRLFSSLSAQFPWQSRSDEDSARNLEGIEIKTGHQHPGGQRATAFCALPQRAVS